MIVHRSSRLAKLNLEIKTQLYANLIRIAYFGTYADIQAADVLTPEITECLKNSGKGRVRRDSNGDYFGMERAPTRTQPGRVLVRREIHDMERAMALPGMRECYPKGLIKVKDADERWGQTFVAADEPLPPMDDDEPKREYSLAERAHSAVKLLGREHQKRSRAVGRYQRPVSWVAADKLISVDWLEVRFQRVRSMTAAQAVEAGARMTEELQPASGGITDPRLLQIIADYYACDEDGRALIVQTALLAKSANPSHKNDADPSLEKTS